MSSRLCMKPAEVTNVCVYVCGFIHAASCTKQGQDSCAHISASVCNSSAYHLKAKTQVSSDKCNAYCASKQSGSQGFRNTEAMMHSQHPQKNVGQKPESRFDYLEL